MGLTPQVAHLTDGEIAFGGDRRQFDGCRDITFTGDIAQLLHGGLELLAGVESHHAPGRNRNLSPVLGFRPGRWGFSATGSCRSRELDAIAALQRQTDFLEKHSTISLASRLLRPTCSKSMSASSALVRVAVMMRQASVSPRDIPRRVRSKTIAASTSRLPESAEFLASSRGRQGFPVRLDTFALVLVEQLDALHDGRRNRPSSPFSSPAPRHPARRPGPDRGSPPGNGNPSR